MPFGKTTEQKEHEAAAKAAEREAEATAKLEAAHRASPLGQAEEARENGQTFFQLEIKISSLKGTKSAFGSSSNTLRHTGGATDLLGQIEEVGWNLEHVGYVFVETGATSTNRVLGTGQGTVTRGEVVGVYLFRAT